jgi:hypothetical protein
MVEAPRSEIAAAPAIASEPAAAPSPERRPIPWAQRLLEIVPGSLTWLVVVIPVILAVVDPEDLVRAVLILDAYWLIRSVLLVLGIRATYLKLQREVRLDWWRHCEELPPAAFTDPDGATWDPRDLWHCALIPTYTERYEVLLATLRAWDDAAYPADRKLVAIITRETDAAGIENVARLQEEFRGRFHRFWHIRDPLLPGIVVGKSAAMAWGGPVLHEHLLEEGLDPRRVIVTDLDSDFRIHPQYLARVSHEYCQDRDRDFRVYQPIPMFHNNLWRVPAAVHVLASAATQWQMFLHSRAYRLVTFASYSASMHLIRDVGYWDSQVIQEDSRFFWRAFFRYGARLKVRPVCLPIYGDCPRSKTYVGTHASQYNQIKRWAWGVSDIPFVFINVLSHPEIPLWRRVYRFFLLQFNHLTWVAMPLLILFGASLPTYFSHLSDLVYGLFPHTALFAQAYDFSLRVDSSGLGVLSLGILAVTLANVSTLIYIEERMVPPRPAGWPIWRRLKSYVEIVFYPIFGLFFSVLPALEAQTRLVLGAYLEYRVTEKE